MTRLHPGITQEVAPNESQRGPKPTSREALIYEALFVARWLWCRFEKGLYDPHSRRSPGITERRRDPGEGRRVGLEARSSVMRLAPSPGAQDSDGILRRPRRPRVDKREHEHRQRGSRSCPSERMRMRFVGIDVAAERHVVAVVDEADRVVIKATPFSEDAEGYTKLFEVLGVPTDALVAMEAT